MKRFWNPHRTNLLALMIALAVSACAVGTSISAPPRLDVNELLAAGFKVIVASTTVQQEWVQSLPPGQIRHMQRNGKKYFIYPDAPGNQIYVGGPQEYQAIERRHPEIRIDQAAKEAADIASYEKQDKNMETATTRDLSDPFLGASWNDLLGW